LGRHLLLRVDHSALSYLRKTPDIMGQAARWLEFIEEYDFRILHRAGQAHNNCDSLSRRPQEGDTDSEGTAICQRIARSQPSPVETTPELSRAAIIEAQGKRSESSNTHRRRERSEKSARLVRNAGSIRRDSKALGTVRCIGNAGWFDV
jgi:hypothetical protein